MENNDVLDYVQHTPGNTNRRILNQMLNQLNNSGGMSAEIYDPEGAVEEAGGIPAYVEKHSNGGDFIISGTLEDTDTSIIIKDLDKTFEESMQAFREGGSVKVKVDAGILLTFANAYSLGTSGVVALMFKLQIAPTVIVDGTWRETASDIVFALPS